MDEEQPSNEPPQEGKGDGVELWASKLQWDWPAPSQIGQLTKERLHGLVSVFKNTKLDNMVKVRILLSCLFLPRAQLESLQPELLALRAAACKDEDEWVLVTAAAVGDYSGQLDTSALLAGANKSELVASTLQGLWDALDTAEPPDNFRPLQEVFMHPDVLTTASRTTSTTSTSPAKHNHFAVRQDQGGKQQYAPPPLSCLVDGSASLGATNVTSDVHKVEHARRAALQQGAAAATTSLFRTSSNTLSAGGGGSTGHGLLKHSHVPAGHGQPGSALPAMAMTGVHAAGAGGSLAGGVPRKGVYPVTGRLSTPMPVQPRQEPVEPEASGAGAEDDMEDDVGAPEQQPLAPVIQEFTYTLGELAAVKKRPRSSDGAGEAVPGAEDAPEDLHCEQI